MDIKKLFATNKRAEEAGVWMDLGQGARVKIARSTSSAYVKKLQDIVRPYRVQISQGVMDDAQAHELFAKAAAGTLLVDWEGVEIDGKAATFSVSEAERLMRELPDFYRTVKGFADDAAAFREQHEAAEQKN